MEGINRWDSIRGFPTGFGGGISHEYWGMNKEGFVEKTGLVSKETI